MRATLDIVLVGTELMELRQKFAEDKRRIAEMKATRKFK